MNTVGNQGQLIAKILVVDDRNENLFAMETILNSLECEVFKAHSGNEALSYTLRHDFALILLDVNMPEMDGFELAELLRDNEETKQIPIIFVTANNKEDKSEFKGYETGAVDYLFKPVETDILLSKVRVFLELNLKKKQLEAIKTELERSNNSLQEFAQVVSHDLKNSLSVVSGLSELVIARHCGGMSDKGKESMKHIAETTERMTRLVTDLLTYAQVDSQPAKITAIDLNAVIADVLADLDSRIEQTNGRVELNSLLPTIEADQTQMYQLFLNLIGNAMKYHHKERTPHVRIGVDQAGDGMDEPAFCQLVIEDNGIGMNQEDIALIFTPFKRLEMAKGFEGTGLGLATVKKIVDQHKGKIEVSSTLGQGSLFRVILPIKQ